MNEDSLRGIVQCATVLKWDVANSLAQTNPPNVFQEYINGLYYKKNGFKDLPPFSGAREKNNIVQNQNALFKDSQLPTANSLTGIGLHSDETPGSILSGEVARFDALSAMYLAAVLPLTNIRHCQFSLLQGNGTKATATGTASVADSAILASNSQSYANNARSESRVLVNTEALFLQYSEIGPRLTDAKAALVPNDYSAITAPAPCISTGTLATLSSIFKDGLTTIRDRLSCVFDETVNYVKVTYWEKSNGTGAKKEVTLIQGDRHTISSYTALGWIPATDNEFLGWSTTPGAAAPMDTYKPGTTKNIGSNLVLYPVFKTVRHYTVTYHKEPTSFLTENGSLSVETLDEGITYAVKAIGNNASAGKPLYYKDTTSRTQLASSFNGYATSKANAENGIVAFKAANIANGTAKISNISKNWNLWPVFKLSKTYHLKTYQEWQVNEVERGETSMNENAKFSWSGDSGQPYATSGKYSQMKYGKNKSTVVKDSDMSIDLGVQTKYISRITLCFAGFINEQNVTHAPSAANQAHNAGKVDSNGFARVYLSTLKLGSINLLSRMQRYTLTSSSIAGWWDGYGKTLPSGQANGYQKEYSKRYYYDRRNDGTTFVNKSFTKLTSVSNKPMLFQYSFINSGNASDPKNKWPWPAPPNNNGTLNCFCVTRNKISDTVCVRIETTIDVPANSGTGTNLTFRFGIFERCLGKGAKGSAGAGQYGGSFGRVYLTDVVVQ